MESRGLREGKTLFSDVTVSRSSTPLHVSLHPCSVWKLGKLTGHQGELGQNQWSVIGARSGGQIFVQDSPGKGQKTMEFNGNLVGHVVVPYFTCVTARPYWYRIVRVINFAELFPAVLLNYCKSCVCSLSHKLHL